MTLETLYIDDEIKEEFIITDKMIDLMKGYVYTLIMRTRYNRSQKLENSNNVTLHTTVLNTIFGKKYNNYLKFLEDNGILEKISDSIRYKRSSVYRLNKNSWEFSKNYKQEIVELIYSKIDKISKKYYKKNDTKNSIKLQEINSEQKITFINNDDVINELDKINKFYRDNYHRFSFDTTEEEVIKYCIENNKTDKSIEQHLDYFHNFQEIAKNSHLSLARTGRSFNCISHIPKFLRERLMLDGERMIEVDIKNSQPQLLVDLMKDLGKDVDENYKKLSKSGKLYDFTLNEVNKLIRSENKKRRKKSLIRQEVTRDVIKVAFLKYFYGNGYGGKLLTNRQKKAGDKLDNKIMKNINTVISNNFPKVNEFIFERNDLADLLQIIETKIQNGIMIKLSNLINNHYSDRLHDSFIFVNDKTGKIFRLLKKEYKKLGISISINSKEFKNEVNNNYSEENVAGLGGPHIPSFLKSLKKNKDNKLNSEANKNKIGGNVNKVIILCLEILDYSLEIDRKLGKDDEPPDKIIKNLKKIRYLPKILSDN